MRRGAKPNRNPGRERLWLHGRGILLVQATLVMGEAILIETSLSYPGFGVQEPTPSWRKMVALGKNYFFRGELRVSTAPALPILFTILGFYLLGDSLRETEGARRELAASSTKRFCMSETCGRTSIFREVLSS